MKQPPTSRCPHERYYDRFVTITAFGSTGEPETLRLAPSDMTEYINECHNPNDEAYFVDDHRLTNLRELHISIHDEDELEAQACFGNYKEYCQYRNLIKDCEKHVDGCAWYYLSCMEDDAEVFDLDDGETYELDRIHDLAAIWGNCAGYGRVEVEILGDDRVGLSTPSKHVVGRRSGSNAIRDRAARIA